MRMMAACVAATAIAAGPAWSETDGRAKLATLSTKGKLLVPKLEKQLTKHLRHFDAALSDAEMKTYFTALERFIHASKTDV